MADGIMVTGKGLFHLEVKTASGEYTCQLTTRGASRYVLETSYPCPARHFGRFVLLEQVLNSLGVYSLLELF